MSAHYTLRECGLWVEGEHSGLVASHEEDGGKVTTHGLQPAHVALTGHSSLRYRDGPVKEEGR